MKIFVNFKKGFGVVEIIVGVGIITIAIVALLGATKSFLSLARDTTYSVSANNLLEEGLEAVRVIRDNGYTDNIGSLTPGNYYYLHFDGSTWVSTTAPNVVDNFFTRKFDVEGVYRDGNSDISDVGVIDPDTKKVNVYVVYQAVSGELATTTVSTYVTNLFND